ncbi:MAG: polysaccharide deacetylase family protein, partial [Armatimonadia bacterium]
ARALARPQARPAIFLCSLIILLLTVALALQPVRARIDGARIAFPRGVTVAEALRQAGFFPETGDQVDVAGRVLRAGAGAATLCLHDGQPVPLESRLRPGDTLSVIPGYDRREPCRERAQLLSPSQMTQPGFAEPAVAGVVRTRVGLVSGLTAVERSYVVPTVRAVAPAKHEKLVALTFDDGPWPGQTLKILATLRKHRARATFFVLGKLARAHPDVARQIVANDCEIGIHSWGHANLARQAPGTVISDMARCQRELEKITGQSVRIMRPPYGALSSRTSAAIRGTGLRIVLWSVDTNDWRRPGANVIYSRIMRGARNGAIILCHDGGGSRSGTIEAVARAVPALQARGYKLVTVSELLGLHPLPEGGAVIAEGQRFEVTPLVAGLTVLVDGEVAALQETPAEVEGQLSIPIKPLLHALGVQWTFSQREQKLTMKGPGGELTVRLNSGTVERAGQAPEKLATPPVLYRNNLMIPLWVALQVAQATAEYDADSHTLRLISQAESLRTGKLGRGAPPAWGVGTNWREYLKTVTVP